MKVKHLVVAFLCMLGCCACSSPKTEVKSPDGHIKMTLTVDENGTPFYNVSVWVLWRETVLFWEEASG